MNLEEKIVAYRALTQEIDALEEKKKALSLEIISEMPVKKIDVAGFRVYKHNRLSIKTSLEEARLHGATKMEEQVDKEKIKELYQNGLPLNGVQPISYLIVTKIKEPAL